MVRMYNWSCRIPPLALESYKIGIIITDDQGWLGVRLYLGVKGNMFIGLHQIIGTV